MTIDKRMSYVNQDGYKNYTKNSDSVTVPRKFKSRADATPTKLAYITAAEEKQLKKQNPGTPHKGPSGIPSYDDYDASAGRYGRSTSGQQMSSFESGAKNERARADARSLGMTPKEVKDIRAAAINAGAGQRVNPGFFDSKHTISPAELAMAKAYRRDPANKYAKQAYRNTRGGLMNFIQGGGLLGNLLSGLGSFFGLGKRYDEPTYDMSEGNTLGLYNERVNPTYYNDLGNEFALGTTPTPSGPFKYGVGPVPPSDPFANPIGPRAVNIPGPYETAADDYWSDKQIINTPGGEIVIDSQGNEVVDMPTAPMGTPWDNPYQESKKGIMETLSDWNPLNLIFGSPAGAAEIDYSKLPGATEKFTPKFDFIEKHNQGVKDYKGTTKQDYVDAITSGAFGNTAGATSWDRNVGDLFEGVNLGKDWSAFDVTPQFISHGQGTGSGYIDIDKDALEKAAIDALPGGFFKAKGGRVGYANGGLASLFTRRG